MSHPHISQGRLSTIIYRELKPRKTTGGSSDLNQAECWLSAASSGPGVQSHLEPAEPSCLWGGGVTPTSRTPEPGSSGQTRKSCVFATSEHRNAKPTAFLTFCSGHGDMFKNTLENKKSPEAGGGRALCLGRAPREAGQALQPQDPRQTGRWLCSNSELTDASAPRGPHPLCLHSSRFFHKHQFLLMFCFQRRNVCFKFYSTSKLDKLFLSSLPVPAGQGGGGDREEA